MDTLSSAAAGRAEDFNASAKRAVVDIFEIRGDGNIVLCKKGFETFADDSLVSQISRHLSVTTSQGGDFGFQRSNILSLAFTMRSVEEECQRLYLLIDVASAERFRRIANF